ncbi:hypothetical protein NQ318_014783 [Aromia moschata]|uniref:EGF-like domain-containing protein n=1 Tax=Aromia moschata TaxID=1265417 RepID=A0AAV8ZBH4_9CUCU|nr:hypothetical protein NQ318_014783 [Aromia moschata]
MLGSRDFIVAGVILYLSVFSLEEADGASFDHRPVNKSRKGICTIEVPTIDLISPEDRRGVIPRGNGSREGYSRIEICCSGWTRASHSYYECVAVCENGCENGNCTAPNVCECKRGFIKLHNNTCIPTCPIGCLHGVCTNTGLCSCNAGYLLSQDGKYCTPHCTGGCGTGGTCVGPESCACSKGFSINRDTNKCGYHCEGGCGEGTCIGPNKCSCKPGYKIQANTCTPECPKGCTNGQCTAPNRCTCKPGWNLNPAGSACVPQCSKPCLNADCVAPNKCACKNGYVPASGSENDNKCVAFCPDGCPNGVCSAPNFCICNPGFVKEFKGSNVCVRRVRRSAMHFELIPEEVLEGL